jgi:hypothetical protein
MFSPARASSAILMRNGQLARYSTALELNIRPPLTAARQKAVQVIGRTSFESWLTERLREATLSRRRSTMAMVPTTITRANTWTVSMVGKAQVETEMKLPTALFWSHSQKD